MNARNLVATAVAVLTTDRHRGLRDAGVLLGRGRADVVGREGAEPEVLSDPPDPSPQEHP